jgi:hypothetical protein
MRGGAGGAHTRVRGGVSRGWWRLVRVGGAAVGSVLCP